MPTSLEHDPKYRCSNVNRGCHTLEMRTNGIWRDIPNTTHLREKGRRKEGVLRSTKPNGRARPLNLLNITTWLISTCSHPCPLCLLCLSCLSILCPLHLFLPLLVCWFLIFCLCMYTHGARTHGARMRAQAKRVRVQTCRHEPSGYVQ